MNEAFLDSNVLIYAITQSEPRADRAKDLLAAGGAISVQVLNEFVNVSRRKLKQPWPTIHADLADIRRLCRPVMPLTIATHESALRLMHRYAIAVYDAVIVASALEAGCTTLFSEDMQNGLVVEGSLTIRNPFVPH